MLVTKYYTKLHYLFYNFSTESGWDNPFRPDGDLSREADEIVSLIKGGKPITPTPPALNQTPICDEKDEKLHVNNVNVRNKLIIIANLEQLFIIYHGYKLKFYFSKNKIS